MRTRPMTAKWLPWALVAAALISAGGLLREAMRDADRMRHRPLGEVRPPPDIINPASAGVLLTGAEREAFMKRAPLRPGETMRPLTFTDTRNETFHIPSRDGKPTVWVVSCGCRECADRLVEMLTLRSALHGSFHAAAFVLTHSYYVWHHNEVGFHAVPDFHLVQDDVGRLFRLMRPPGNDPNRMPAVWACDGHGVIRYVAQPEGNNRWVPDLRRALTRSRGGA